MNTFTVQVQIPEALRDIGYSDAEICREVPVLLVLKRFRQGAISSGKAARILGLARRDFLDLLGREGMPIYDPSDEQFAEERKTVERMEVAPPRMARLQRVVAQEISDPDERAALDKLRKRRKDTGEECFPT